MRLAGRKLSWRAQVKRKGLPELIKHFATKEEAELWSTEQERSIPLTGLPLTISGLQKHAAREIVERYRDEVTPTKAGKAPCTPISFRDCSGQGKRDKAHKATN
jgi:hypothetical protein